MNLFAFYSNRGDATGTICLNAILDSVSAKLIQCRHEFRKIMLHGMFVTFNSNYVFICEYDVNTKAVS